MGVVFSKAFAGVTAPANEPNASREPQVPAQFWMNIGYSMEVENPTTGETTTTFISLPGGIPLDTPSKLEVRKGSKAFIAQNLARNQLQSDILAQCADMTPGEDRYMELDNGLAIQIHRVKEANAPVEAEDNPYIRPLKLFA